MVGAHALLLPPALLRAPELQIVRLLGVHAAEEGRQQQVAHPVGTALHPGPQPH